MLRTIDCHYTGPQIAASYLLEDHGEVAFIETNTSRAVPLLLAALNEAELEPAQVKWIIATHIHLDHAGGAGALLAKCPNATLLLHPRAAPHAIDPARIIAGATKVYGAARFDELYGTIVPAPAERVTAMLDNHTVTLGHRTLRFLHTKGHANHHFVVFDDHEQAVFTGDSFGIVYPATQTKGLFAFPTTSPTDFDGAEALRSIDRILATGASRVCPTHFGIQSDVAGIAAQLRAQLEQSIAWVEHADNTLADDALDAYFEGVMRAAFQAKLTDAGLGSDRRAAEAVALDIDLNAQGLAFAVRKLRFKRT